MEGIREVTKDTRTMIRTKIINACMSIAEELNEDELPIKEREVEKVMVLHSLNRIYEKNLREELSEDIAGLIELSISNALISLKKLPKGVEFIHG